MDIRSQRRALSLIYRLFLRGRTDAHQIPYQPSKTTIPPPAEGKVPLVSPETLGIPSSAVEELLAELERERGTNVHTIAIARAGRVFSMAAAPGYRTELRHQTYSLCKTVTGLCIGMLVDEGRFGLDTPAYRLVGEGLPPLLSPRTKAITVRHLLSMTSGVMFAEVGAVTEENWVRSFFESSVAFPPGSRFAYNSMNSYILSVIVERTVGKPLHEFAAERLFAPLGIKETLWEVCPHGHTKGGWGLYLAAEDMLKIGELIMNGGTYHHVRLLSREWMRMMVKPHAKVSEALGAYDYGFHIWVARDRSSYLANGMLGQNVWIHPKNGIVLAVNAGNCEFFQNGPMLAVIARHLGVEFGKASLKPDRRALRALRAREAEFFGGRTWTHPQEADIHTRGGNLPTALFDALCDTELLAERNNYGILPLFIMLMQNNLAAGITSLRFCREGKDFSVTVTEGKESYRLPLGFGYYAPTTLTVRGEQFLVATRAEFCEDTDGEAILKLDILFPEMASSRRLRLYYDTDKPTIVLSEQPGRRMVDVILQLFTYMPRAKLLGDLLRTQMDRDMVAYRVRSAYEPTLRLGRGERPEAEDFPMPEAGELPLLSIVDLPNGG